MKAGGFKSLVKTKSALKVHGGMSEQSAEGTTHSFSDSERIAFCDWINSSLAEDKELHDFGILPINPDSDDELFKRVQNGILLW